MAFVLKGDVMADTQQILLNTLLNVHVRSSTRQSVLESALERLDIKVEDFVQAIELESQNKDNIQPDQRERNRSQGTQMDLVERELRMMAGKPVE